MKKAVKLGKIEFYRFVFCLGVLFFHMGKYFRGEPSLKGPVRFEFFPHGAIGVEFFFLVSGFFMAKSIHKKVLADHGHAPAGEQFSLEYLYFMKRKFLRILPWHIPMFILTFIVYAVVYYKGCLELFLLFIRNIPAFFLIHESGIHLGDVLHIEWYISSMLLSMAILYPFMRKYYYSFVRVICPVIVLFGLGYMQQVTGALTGVSVWMGIALKGMLRGLLEVALGTVCFEVSRALTKAFDEKGKACRLFWTFVEAGCFIGSILFIITTLGTKYEILILGAFFVMIAVSASGISYGTEFFDKKIFYFLGKLSLSIYLSQLAAIYIVMEKMQNLRLRYQFAVCVVLLAVFVVFDELCAKPISAWIEKNLLAKKE